MHLDVCNISLQVDSMCKEIVEKMWMDIVAHYLHLPQIISCIL
jgi:hypothetical protein